MLSVILARFSASAGGILAAAANMGSRPASLIVTDRALPSLGTAMSPTLSHTRTSDMDASHE